MLNHTQAMAAPLADKPPCVGGFVACSTQDWPDQLAAVVFIRGCPWRCNYCHNPHLQTRDWADDRAWNDVLLRLAERRGLLDGVVFSGGEPTADAALASAITSVRALGLRVALHTAGCYPQRLALLLPLVDWIGLDIKADVADYEDITGVPGSGDKAWESLRLIQESGVPHEIRVTAHPDWLPEDRLCALMQRLAAAGVSDPVIQAARLSATLDSATPSPYLDRAALSAAPGQRIHVRG